MDWPEALEIEVARTGNQRLRYLCQDHPDPKIREAYRASMVRHASPQAFPGLATQAVSALHAAGRFVASGFATVDRAEFDRRKAICAACEHFDAPQNRCRACGCFLARKPWGARESCPIGKW